MIPLRIKTGSYTGDGATAQDITGLGFKPKFLIIIERATSDATTVYVGMTSDTIVDDHASGGAIQVHDSGASGIAATFEANQVVQLDGIDTEENGFTVDDNGADEHPNKNSTTYNYIAFG